MSRIRLDLNSTQGIYARGVKIYIDGKLIERVAFIENRGIEAKDVERQESEGLIWVAEFDAEYKLEDYDNQGNLKLIVSKPKEKT